MDVFVKQDEPLHRKYRDYSIVYSMSFRIEKVL